MKAQTSTQPIQQPKQNDEDASMLADTSFTNVSNRGSIIYQSLGQPNPDRFSIPMNCYQNNTMNYIIETPKSLARGSYIQKQENDFFDVTSNASFVFEHSQTQRRQDRQSIKVQNEPIKISNFKDLLRLFRINLADDDQTFELNGQSYVIDFDEYVSEASPRVQFFQNRTHIDTNQQISPILMDKTPLEDKTPIVADELAMDSFNPLRESKRLELQVMPTQLTLPKMVEQKDIEIQVSEEEFPSEFKHSSDRDRNRISIESHMALRINESPEVQKYLSAHNKQISQQIVFKNTLFESQNSNISDYNSKPKEAHVSEFGALRRHMTMGENKLAKVNFNALELSRIESERKLLEIQIQETQKQLQETQKQLQHINSMYIHQENVEDAKLHLAFMFASPLVMRCQGNSGKQHMHDNFKPMPQLEFKKEFKEIQNSIRETHRELRIKSMQATVENLTQMLSSQPLALHFSGHGIENTPQYFGRDWHLKKDEGNFLLFETDDGEGELVSQRKLSEFIQQSKTKFEFVFVASCNSEPVGRIFLNAGARHVICVKNGQQISDGAVITFSKSFYSSVFSQTITICDAYKMAQNQVEIKFGKGEANKFSLLTQEQSMPLNYIMPTRPGMPQLDPEFLLDDDLCGLGLEEEHKCKLFGPLKDGDLESLDVRPRFCEFPAKVDNYIGRQIELHEIVRSVCSNRLVNIIGLPGIGKTSLVKNAIHYIAERKLFKTGIIFIPTKGLITCELFLKQLITFIKENFDLDEDEQKHVDSGNVQGLIKISLNYLKDLQENLLIVFDNAEDLLYHDKLAFRNLVNDLLNKCQLLHILMTSRTTLGALQDVQEKIFVLQELNVNTTVKLFISRSRDIPEEEIKELLTVLPDNTLSHEQKVVVSINDHHLFKLLGGNPHAIVLAAPLLLKMQLKELYLLMNSKEMHDVLKVDGITDSTVASLRLSLEASIKILKKEDTESLRFFFLIGMLPGGVYEEDLEQLWKDNWQKYVEQLLNLSLLQKKEQEHDHKTKYILPPFMSNYAEAKISDEDKILFQNQICKYYAKVCQDIFLKNGKSYKKKKNRQSELNHQFMESLLKHETNIWACVNRLVDGTVSLEKEDSLEDQEENQRIQRFSNLIAQEKSLARTFTVKFDRANDSEDQSQNEDEQKSTGLHIKSAFSNRRRNNNLKEDAFMPLLTEKALKQLRNKDQQQALTKLKSHEIFNSPTTDLLEEICEQDYEEESSSSSEGETDHMAYQIFGKTNEQHSDRRLEDIIRNSVINFQRPSSIKIKLSTMKNSEIGKKTLYKTTTTSALELNKAPSRKESTQKVEELHSLEKLVLYYAMNILLLGEGDSVEHLIVKYGLKIKGCQLYVANLKRIQGLIQSKKKEQGQQTIAYFEEALKLYQEHECYYGQAVCHFSLGYFYRSKICDFIVDKSTDEDKILLMSRRHLESSLHYYVKVNHLIGQALCHKQLLMVATKLNDKELIKAHAFQSRELSKYIANFKNSPFVLRVHGNEISLMSEVITNNENVDLFAKVRLVKKGTSYDNHQVQLVSKVPQLLPQQSTPIQPEDVAESLTPPGYKHQRNFSLQNLGNVGQQDFAEDDLRETKNNGSAKKDKQGLFKVASNLEVVNEEDNEAPIMPINNTPVKEASSDKITDFLLKAPHFGHQSRNKAHVSSSCTEPLMNHASPSIFEDANIQDMEEHRSAKTPRQPQQQQVMGVVDDDFFEDNNDQQQQ